MPPSTPEILMITPFSRQQRGNSLTSSRLKKGLESQGFSIDLVSLEDSNSLAQLKTNLKTKDYSLVHALHARHLARVLKEIPDLHGLPLILTTTGTDIHIDMYGTEKYHLGEAFQAADKIVVFQQDFVNMISSSYPRLEQKLVTIPQGIYLPEGPRIELRQLDLEEDAFIFLLPSGLRPVKNIELAINSLEKLAWKHPQLRLLIIGADLNHDYSQAIMHRIQNLSWVNYPGDIPHEQMRSLMMLIDVVINCSQAEGQPQAALEAMSLAKPCIFTAVPGNLNIIEPGREGFYVHNEAEFVQAAQTLLCNPELTQKMGRTAQQLVEKNFSLERELFAYTSIYRQLLR